MSVRVKNHFHALFKPKSAHFEFTSSIRRRTDNIITTTTRKKNVFIHVNDHLTRFLDRHGTNNIPTCLSYHGQSGPPTHSPNIVSVES